MFSLTTARWFSTVWTLLWATLFILFSHSLSAQNGLDGRITDKNTSLPLFGVSVYIHDLRQGAVTDTSGRYHIANLPTGRFLVEVSYLGYASAVKTVLLNGDQTLDFTISSSPTELNGVTVTGVSAATEVKRSPIPMQIIGRTVLQQTVATNLIDALARQPGISQVSTGPAISKPVIRGLSYNRVITLYNGVRHEGQQWGDEHGIEVDEYSVDRIEIIKGPGSLLYGSDGIAGVINLLPPTPEPEGHIGGSLLANYQTNNGLIGYSVMTAGTRKGINWLARVSGKKAGNYQNAYDGRVYNSGFRELDGNGYVGINRKWGYSQLHFTSFDQHTAITEGERDSTGHFSRPIMERDGSVGSRSVTDQELTGYSLGIPNQRIRHKRLLLINNIYLGTSRLAFNVGYQLSQRQEFGDITHPAQYGLYFYLPTIDYDLKYFFPEKNGWKTTIGVSGMSQKNKNQGIEFLIPDYQLFDAGGFVFTQKSFKRFALSGGLRYDQRQMTTQDLLLANDHRVPRGTPGAEAKFTGFNARYGTYSGSFGVTYQVSSPLLVKFNLARGYRAPNIAEIGSNGRHQGTFRYELGEPSLKAETSLQADLGMVYTSAHLTLEAGIFTNQIQNYIYAQRLRSAAGGDSISSPTDPVPTYKYGQNTARLSGGEISIDLHPHPFDWLHFENAFSLVRGQNLGQPDSARYLPFMPPARFQSELRANLKKAGRWLNNGFAKISLDYYFEQNQFLQENHSETRTLGYTLLNAGIGSDVMSDQGHKKFTIYLLATNILDVAYQSHLSRLKYNPVNPATGRMGVYNMGRTISLKVIVPLVFAR